VDGMHDYNQWIVDDPKPVETAMPAVEDEPYTCFIARIIAFFFFAKITFQLSL
jgi:hypothetical protein